MRYVSRLCAAALAASLVGGPASATEPVDVTLVLCVDASGSIDPEELRLQREGYARAITDPKVLSAIRNGPRGAIAVALVEWGTPGAPKTAVDWMRIADAASARLFADAVVVTPRTPQSYNAIGDAIVHATTMIKASLYRGERAVIDVSGDGPDMRSLIPAPAARDAAVSAGITINALAINKPGSGPASARLDEHYERYVIGGPGAFVIVAEDYKHFAEAILTKLVREIAALPPATQTAAGTPR